MERAGVNIRVKDVCYRMKERGTSLRYYDVRIDRAESVKVWGLYGEQNVGGETL